jgi:hypothetical protein
MFAFIIMWWRTVMFLCNKVVDAIFIANMQKNKNNGDELQLLKDRAMEDYGLY